eukprot:TRINITY_DN15484_c0_g1_i2.p1 TRINITY_DN15484_c0_g1~~TRINITY_DN15484_c0_g1_i2.p1  ORF type:complete len:381 (+),score=65.17 TRINITY_DN15484_c0_g1_i2:492-1634(+)
MEMPASCSGMCTNGGCPGQWDTMNLNTYLYTNQDGTGPAYANMCVRSPSGKPFVDDQYHRYAFEWHTGSSSCDARVDFFFDDEYIGTNDVFVPSRGSRLALGIWPAGANWVGEPDWEETKAYIAEVHICPFNQEYDSNYPQIYDQPSGHDSVWTAMPPMPPVLRSLPGPSSSCPGDSPAGPTCSSRTARPFGCGCGNSSFLCASQCCDFNATPDPDNGICAPLEVCAIECALSSSRPEQCSCGAAEQCQSGCCQENKCVAASLCAQPCSTPSARPEGCACELSLQCASGCCDSSRQECAAQQVCSSQCSSEHRPIGCPCQDSAHCSSQCCTDDQCKDQTDCPTPSGCDQPSGRAVGCACDHSWECASQGCDGHCQLHLVD